MFVFNLDFSRAPDSCDPMGWHAIVDKNGTSRPGFIHLFWLAKRPYALLDPPAIQVTMPATWTTPITVPLTLDSIGISPATWYFETGEPWITVTPATAMVTETSTFTVAIDLSPDTTPPGSYTTAITLTAQEDFFFDPWYPERMGRAPQAWGRRSSLRAR